MSEGFRIGEWTVRPAAMEMEPHGDAGTPCRLTPKAMSVLTCLAASPGQVVPRETLIAQVWDGAFVSDDALSTVIYELRKAFDDKGSDPRYIETIRKGGYRLIAPVRKLESTVAAKSTVAPESTVAPAAARLSSTTESSTVEQRAPRPAARRIWPVLLAALLLMLVAVWLVPRSRSTDGTLGEGVGVLDPSTVESLAVLPITVLDLEGKQDRLADALTEMLIADLAQICPQEIRPGLAVRGQEWDLERAARHLAVDAVVEGTLVRSGNRLWLSIQLVDVQTGQMLWGGSFEREVADLPSLRSLAQDIALRLQLEVAPPVPGLSLPDPE